MNEQMSSFNISFIENLELPRTLSGVKKGRKTLRTSGGDDMVVREKRLGR